MKFLGYFKEPAFINLLQVIGYAIAMCCGLLAAMNGLPNIITFQLGTVLSVLVGSLLVAGGFMGGLSVYQGNWGRERIAIWIVGLGYVAMLLPTLAYAFTPGKASTLWLIVALEVAALIDCLKRYRRIDWAYLDPTK